MNFINPLTIGLDERDLKVFVYNNYKADYERIIYIKNLNYYVMLPMKFKITDDIKLNKLGILDEVKGITIIRDMYKICGVVNIAEDK